jgi:hypothetical protein
MMRDQGDESPPVAPTADAGASEAAARTRGRGEDELAGLLDALVQSGARGAERLVDAATLAVAVAEELGLGRSDAETARQVALLQDIGRLDLPAELFAVSGPLDASTRQQLCAVPLRGEARVRNLAGLAHLAPFVRAQHERWDGSGYPDGLMQEQIPLPSRISLVCDAYLAMLTPRPGRDALDHDGVCEVLRLNAAAQFCPHSVAALLVVLGGWAGRRERGPDQVAEPSPVVEDLAVESPAPATPPRRDPVAERAAVTRSLLDQFAGSRAAAPPLESDGQVRPPPSATNAPVQATGREAVRVASRRSSGGVGVSTRGHRAVQAAMVLVAIALGVVFTLPLPNVDRRCPPRGEGLTMCVLQKAWLPAITVTLAMAVAALLLHWLIFSGPSRFRAWRDHRARVIAPPPFAQDPVLVAANWGLTYHDAHPTKRSWKPGTSPALVDMGD